MANLAVIDIGFLYVKALINRNPIMLKSVVGDGRSLEYRDLDMTTDEVKNSKDLIISKNGSMDYFISDLAIEQSETIYHSLKSDRFNSEATEMLIKTVFGIGFGYGSHSTYIVSGLPTVHYSTFKDNIKGLFLGEGQKTHEYSVSFERYMNGAEMQINSRMQSAIGTVRTIEGRFLPQPHAAGMDRILDKDGNIADKVLAGKTVAVIDPGFGTSDIYVFSALSPVQKYTFSTFVAMNTAYTLIANKVQDRFGITLPFYKVEEIVRTGKFIKDGVEADMGEVIRWAMRATASQLVAEIYNKWKNTHEIDHILVAGGGGARLFEYISKEFPSIEMIEDSQWAIARGYDKWGRRTWKGLL